MNDFTKDELQQVIKWATTDIDLNPSELEVSLFEKIVAIIDNYCEHQDCEKLYMSVGGIENFGCKGCGCQFIKEPIAYKKTIVADCYE